MTAAYTRTQAEHQLAHSLSRQIGYTTGAFSLKRMAKLVALFGNSYAYQFELVRELLSRGLGDSSKLHEDYALGVVDFATRLGIVSRQLSVGPTHLQRYVLTDHGIALRAAQPKYPDLEILVLESLVLENDADAYFNAIEILLGSEEAASLDAAAAFRNRIYRLRCERVEWLVNAIPNQTLNEKVITLLPWVKIDKRKNIVVRPIGIDFGRHHFFPRRQWAMEELMHWNAADSALTLRGKEIYQRISGINCKYKWIAPHPSVLKILQPKPGAFPNTVSAPCLDLLRPVGHEIEPSSRLINDVADFLEDTFPLIRLHHARQASTSAAFFYLRQRERELNQQFSWQSTIEAVSKIHRSRFSFFSSRESKLAHYQVRGI